MKKHLRTPSSSIASAAAILAGGVLFTGPARAALLLSEDFEALENAFGMGTYAYSQNYTLPNTLTPDGGLQYGRSGNGIPNQVSTNSFPLAPLSLTAGTGITATQIDSGLGRYDFRGQFSTWRLQGDYAQIDITFKDAANVAIGNPVTIGGAAFTAALAAGQNPKYTDARAWGESALQGIVPTGARTLDVILSATKTADGTAIDGYVDNISLTIVPVPEPTTFGLVGCAALGWLRRRRR